MAASSMEQTEAAQEVTILREVTDRCKLSQSRMRFSGESKQPDDHGATDPVGLQVDDFVQNAWKALGQIELAS